MKRFVYLLLALTLIASLTACTGVKVEEKVIKIGLNGTESPVWRHIQQEAKKEGIIIELVWFSDYVRPNMALADGEIQANAFQTVIYFEDFKQKHNLDLTSIGNTILAPMAIYSNKITSLDHLKDRAKIGIPNDATNGGRALVLLQSAGLIKLREGAGNVPTLKDVAENPKNLEIIELVATQIPRSLSDLDIAAINNGVAVQAGLHPVTGSIYIEDFSDKGTEPYINIIAVRTKDKENATLRRIVGLYHTDKVKDIIEQEFKGAQIPAW